LSGNKLDAFDVLEIYFRSDNETSDVQETITKMLTLDNIFTYASEDELSAIVHSIIGRLWEQKHYSEWGKDTCCRNIPTDKELHKLAKGLRKPQ